MKCLRSRYLRVCDITNDVQLLNKIIYKQATHHHSNSLRLFLEGYFSWQSSPSSPHPGWSQVLSPCRQIHSFFSESYFTQASCMQCSRSRAPDTMFDSLSSGRSSLTYCDSFSSSLMSARVPTPLGNLAAASLTMVRMVTQAGRQILSRGWSRGLPDTTDTFLATGATVTFRPSSQVQTQGLVGLLQRWYSWRRQLSTQSLFLGRAGRVILYMASFLVIFSSPSASSSSWVLILPQSQRKWILGLYSSSMKSSSSSSVSVAWLFSDISSTSDRSDSDSTSLFSSSITNRSRFTLPLLCLSTFFNKSWQISRLRRSLICSSSSSSRSLDHVKQPVLSLRVKSPRCVSCVLLPSRACLSPSMLFSGKCCISAPISYWLNSSSITLMLTIPERSSRSSILRGREKVSPSQVTLRLCSSMMTSSGCSWASSTASWGVASVSCSILCSSAFLMLLQKREWYSQQSGLLKRCAMHSNIQISANPPLNNRRGLLPRDLIWTVLDNKIIMPKYADLSDDSDTERQVKKKQPQLQVRLEKNKLDNVDPSEIIVNLSKTHYDIIETVVEELGWTTTESKKKQNWDIMWTDNHIEVHDLFRLNVQQKISHYPAIYVLAKKNFLGRNLMRMAKAFPSEYNFFPPTWTLPSDLGEFMRQCESDSRPIYIFKPDAGCQGKGISLFTKIEEIEEKSGVVQTYINNPLLVDGLKFDLRIYVLIYGCDPVRIYCYEEGLARFATEPYEKARKRNLKDNYIHLTNYAINKNNKKFIFNTSDKQMHVGHKRSLSSVFGFLAGRGVNVEELKKKIDRMIVKTLLVGKPTLEHMYGLSQKDDFAKDHCFQILGFDVMLDDQMDPILLEVNHTPSFATDTPLDRAIKKQLIKQTLLVLNVNPATKKARVEQKLDEEERRAQRKQVKLSQEQRDRLKRIIELEKDEHDSKTLVKYRKIYPVQGKQYKQMEQYAVKVFNQQSGFKNKQVGRARDITIKRIGSRPASLEHMPSPKKIKAESKKEEQVQKLPNISPKRGVKTVLTPQIKAAIKIEKGLDLSSPLKSRVNNGQKLRARLNIIEQSTFEKRVEGRQGNFLQPKVMQISNVQKETQNKNGKGKSVELKLEMTECSQATRKNFTDFMGLSTRQKNILPGDKNSIVVVKKQRALSYREAPRRRMAESVNLFEGLSDELMILKGLAGRKKGK